MLREAATLLSSRYGDPRLHNKDRPLDELIFIILSVKTTESSYLRTYQALKNAFDDWFEILETPPGSVACIIASGGLAEKKEGQIRSLLKEIRSRSGENILTSLSQVRTGKAEAFLISLPGVGLKTARCVLMYSLRREVFPVDTHVRRVLARLGVIRFQRLTDRVQNTIQDRIPADIRYKLHVNLVAHGRDICRARKPECSVCILKDMCAYYSDIKMQENRQAVLGVGLS